jgi:hypothetical protein
VENRWTIVSMGRLSRRGKQGRAPGRCRVNDGMRWVGVDQLSDASGVFVIREQLEDDRGNHMKGAISPFEGFTDEALEALKPAIDALAPAVAKGWPIETGLVHEFWCELIARRNYRLLAEPIAKGLTAVQATSEQCDSPKATHAARGPACASPRHCPTEHRRAARRVLLSSS